MIRPVCKVNRQSGKHDDNNRDAGESFTPEITNDDGWESGTHESC